MSPPLSDPEAAQRTGIHSGSTLYLPEGNPLPMLSPGLTPQLGLAFKRLSPHSRLAFVRDNTAIGKRRDYPRW